MLPFKTGAFVPGVPVQPLLIKYHYQNYDTMTWAVRGPGALQTIFTTLSQPYTPVTLKYLPVYYPNQEEKEDFRLYAKNVSHYMAKEHEIGVSKYHVNQWLEMTGSNSNEMVNDLRKSD